MMPLIFADKGTVYKISKISGNTVTKQYLADLGFVAGGEVTVVSESNGNLIVNVKGARVAIGKEMARRIMI